MKPFRKIREAITDATIDWVCNVLDRDVTDAEAERIANAVENLGYMRTILAALIGRDFDAATEAAGKAQGIALWAVRGEA